MIFTELDCLRLNRSGVRTLCMNLTLGGMVFVSLAQAESSIQLAPVVVQAVPEVDSAGFVADEATLGPLGRKKLLDIPYSISVVKAELIQNQQASSLTDVLKYLPSTQMEARGGMDVGRPQSRGMQGDVVAHNHLDGLNIVSTTAFPIEMLERVEVVNGLAGALYGPASPAGSFNYVQKRPTADTLRSLSLAYRSRSAYQLHADLGGHVDTAGRIGYRLNFLAEDGESFVKQSDLERRLVAVAMDFKLSDATVVELNASHYSFDKFGLPGGFAYAPNQQLPAAPDASRPGYGQPFAGMALETNTFSARLRHRLAPGWDLAAGFGRQFADRYLATPTNTLVGNGENYTTRARSSVNGRFVVNSNQMQLNGELMTGQVHHDLLLSTTGYDWEIYSALNSMNYLLGSASFDQPQVYPAQHFLDSGPRYYAGMNRVQSVSIGDTLTFSPKWSLMAVGSYADLRSNWATPAGVRTSEYGESGLSSTLALTYKMQPNLSTYVAYADTLQEGAVAGATAANANAILEPYRSKQYELGLKYAFERMNASAALFQISRPFAFTGADNYFKVQGEQRNKGLELAVNGEFGKRWAVFGGLTYLNARLGNTPDALTEGKDMVGVPKLQASLLAEYKLLEIPGLTLTGNLRHTGRRAINTQNTAYVDGYNVLDIGLRYSHRLLGQRAVWRVSVNNVTDEQYWVSIFPGNIDGAVAAGSAFLGDPLEIRAALTLTF